MNPHFYQIYHLCKPLVPCISLQWIKPNYWLNNNEYFLSDIYCINLSQNEFLFFFCLKMIILQQKLKICDYRISKFKSNSSLNVISNTPNKTSLQRTRWQEHQYILLVCWPKGTSIWDRRIYCIFDTCKHQYNCTNYSKRVELLILMKK